MTKTPRLPAIDPQAVELREGSRYPGALAEPCAKRLKRAMGDAAGLTHFGVNLVWLPPGAWSSQRHWRANEDEFINVREGKLTLITEVGEKTFPAAEASMIADVVARDLPFYDAAIPESFVAGMNQFAQDMDLLDEPVGYDRVVATRFSDLWAV